MSDTLQTAASVPANPEAWVSMVRSAWQTSGHRITEPRMRVLRRIAGYITPFTAEQLYTDLLHDSPPPGRATVYRALEQLHEAGWLARLHPGMADSGYIASWPGHLHHLICTNCGAVVAFEGCALGDLADRLTASTDFTIEGHLLQIYGRCAKCRVAAAN